LIALAVRVRVKRLLEVERIRTHIATDLHDDIGSGLTRIAVLSDVASQKVVGEPVSVLPILEKMGTSARELHDAMGDVIWSIDPVHESLASVVGRLKVFAREICEGDGIELAFSEEAVIDAVKLNPQSLRSLLLIGKEALSNAVRHSQCTKITVRLAVDGGRIILSVADNGKGFLAGREGGNGLNNMKRRATKSGGDISISSGEGKGTAVEARIPA
ncbi:MAG TPA: ATP-binding protein, partial [Bacteroidota bacterium]